MRKNLSSETSLGLLETKGLIGAITAADAMAKAADVALVRRHRPGGARMVVVCRGDLASCAAAVAAGSAAAREVGELLCATVLARPEEGAELLCGELLQAATDRRAAQKAARTPKAQTAPKAAAKPTQAGRPESALSPGAAPGAKAAPRNDRPKNRKPSGNKGK